MNILSNSRTSICRIKDQILEESYQMMAQDVVREAEALEWAEATVGDGIDKTNDDQQNLSKVCNL